MSELGEPGVGNSLSIGWQALKENALVFFLAVLLVAVLVSPLNIGDGDDDTPILVSILLLAYWLMFLPVINYGADLIFLRGVRGDAVEIETFVEGFRKYLNVVLASLLVVGLVGISLVAFIVPGIYVAARLVFVSYLVMDQGLDPISAVERSWRLTRGHVLKVIGLALMAIPLSLIHI